MVHFPLSDSSNSKKGPALVLEDLAGNDIILCQITGKNISDIYSISFNTNDSKNRKPKKAKQYQG